MNRYFIFAIPILLAIFIGSAHAFTLTIQGYYPYSGDYWGVAGESSSSSPDYWSAGVYTTSYSASAGLDLSSPLTWNWGDGTTSTFSINTAGLLGATPLEQYNGDYQVNGQTYSPFNYCNVSQYDGGSNGYAQTYFTAYVSNGDCVFQETHDYTSTGIYSVYVTGASPTAGSYSSNTITYVMVVSPTLSISTQEPSCDAGDAQTLIYSINDGENTLIPSYQVSVGSTTVLSNSMVSSPIQSNTYSVNEPVGTYSVTLTAYNFPPPIYSNGASTTFTVYPDIQSPTLSISQSPKALNAQGTNQVVATVAMTLTVTIPQQGGEGQPQIQVSWGDNTANTTAGVDTNTPASSSNGNWVFTLQHTYQTAGNYNIQVTAYSYNYIVEGSAYGSTSSSSTTVTVEPYINPSVSISLPNTNVCNIYGAIYSNYPATYTFSLTTGSYPITSLVVNWGGNSPNSVVNNPGSTVTLPHTYYVGTATPESIIATVTDSLSKTSSQGSSITIQPYQNPSLSATLGITPTYNNDVIAETSTTFSVTVDQGTCPLNTISWNWGDGSSNSGITATSGVNSETHTYKISQGQSTLSDTIGITVTDSMGASASNNYPVTIEYQYPTVSSVTNTTPLYVTPPGSIWTDGFAVTLGAGTNPLNTISWNWGDGSNPLTGTAIPGSNTANHQYFSVGSKTITVTATDTLGFYNSSTTTITINPYPLPVLSNLTANETTIYTGIPVSFSVNVAQASGGFPLSKVVFDFDAGNSSDTSAITTINNPNYGTISATYIYQSAGTYTVSATAIDEYNAYSTINTTVTVNVYYPPKITNVTLIPPPNTNPANSFFTGLPVTLNFSLTTGNYSISNFTIVWDDGTSNYTVLNSTLPYFNNFSYQHTYTSAGNYTIEIVVYDSNGFYTLNYTPTFTVYPYTLPSVSPISTTAVIVNQQYLYSVNITEGTEPISLVTFNFAGTIKNITLNNSLGGVVSVPYTFTQAGNFTVNVTATDVLGNVSAVSTNIVYSQALPIINVFTFTPYNNATTVYSSVPVTFTINLSQGSNPLNYLIMYYGDGANQTVALGNVSSANLTLEHSYNPGAYSPYFVVYDSNNNPETSNQLFFSVSQYQPPQANSITPTLVYSVVNNTFTVNITPGSYPTSYMNISWGDGNQTSNITLNGSLNATVSHAYPYSTSASYVVNITVYDINGRNSTKQFLINTTYQPLTITSITPNQTYELLNQGYTFNIANGSFPVAGIRINWGDGSPTISISITSNTPVLNHTYSSVGTFYINATAYDVNNIFSPIFTQSISVLPYIPPTVSQISPTSAQATIPQNFTVVITQGTFPLQNLTINWYNGLVANSTVVYTNITNGTNIIPFTYQINGTFTAVETIYDVNGFNTTNNTLINVRYAPWTFSSLQPIINYTLINTTSSGIATAQLNITWLGNVTLPVNFTIQSDTLQNYYICTPAINNQTLLFSISCSPNPYTNSYPNTTIYYTIYATSSDGNVQSTNEQVNIYSVLPSPQLQVPFNPNLTISQPLPVPQYEPINTNAVLLSLLGILGLSIFAYLLHEKLVGGW